MVSGVTKEFHGSIIFLAGLVLSDLEGLTDLFNFSFLFLIDFLWPRGVEGVCDSDLRDDLIRRDRMGDLDRSLEDSSWLVLTSDSVKKNFFF